MSIQRKFVIAISVLIGLLVLIAVIASSQRESRLIQSQVNTEVASTKNSILQVLEVSDRIMARQVDASLNVFNLLLDQQGQPSQTETVTVGNERVSNLSFGDMSVADNHNLVDELTRLVGGTATLFSRSGDRFIRISTNVQKSDGSRAVGTELAQGGAAIKAILQNKSYFGQVDILGAPYVTAYQPITRGSDVIGIAYVGYKANLEALTQVIEETRILDTGFVAVFDRNNVLQMHSEHQSPEAVQRITNDQQADWQMQSTEFGPWGYRIVTAVHQPEISSRVNSAVLMQSLPIVIGGIILLAVLIFLVRTIITARLQSTIEMLNKITNGEGDLTQRFNSTSNDELGVMARGFDKLLEQISEMVGDISEATTELLSEANKLEDIAEQSGAAVGKQTKKTEQAATAVHELSIAAQTVASNAMQAEEAARSVNQLTQSSNEVIQDMSLRIAEQIADADASEVTLTSLNQASGDIANVLQVIHGVAEQTNLLALNAAIEAARAGEQGRGFAVVADEVRSLAGRTQKATEEINTMITRLQSGVKQVSDALQKQSSRARENGAAIEKASASLDEVMYAASDINDRNTEIASAAEEQSMVANEISQNVEEISEQSLQTAAYAEQTSSASSDLRTLIERVRSKLASYKV